MADVAAEYDQLANWITARPDEYPTGEGVAALLRESAEKERAKTQAQQDLLDLHRGNHNCVARGGRSAWIRTGDVCETMRLFKAGGWKP